MKTTLRIPGFLAGLMISPVIAGLPQEIAAVNIVVKAPDDGAFALPPDSSAGLPVTWAALAGPATVSGSTATLTGSTGAVTLRGRQAGDATFDPAPDRYATFVVETGGGFLMVAAGEAHVAGIKSDGKLWTWGRNTNGQLGDATNTDRATPGPITVSGSSPWASVACGSTHTVARRSDGTLWAWGGNASGQLGFGHTTDVLFPTQIGSSTAWAGVACGANHTVAWRTDGSLYAWGNNSQGQLGDGTIANRTAPLRIGIAQDWVEVSCGALHSVGRRAGGSLWAWGANTYGQLGDATATRRMAPVRIGTGSDWTGVSVGFFFSAGRRSGGTVWAWGNNDSGQLGDGTRVGKSSPQQVGTDSNWTAISCGAACVIGRKSDNWMWAWGDNSAGQLGDLTTTDPLTPIQTLEGPWGSVAVGAACVLAVRNQALWTWGTNDNEQLALPPSITGVTAVPPAPRLPYRSLQTSIALPSLAALSSTLRGAVTSALPAVLRVVSGPAVLSADTHAVTFTGEGFAQIEISHPGDGAWEAAPAQTFTVQIDGTGPVFTAAPANQTVQIAAPGGRAVNFTATAVDAVTGPAPVVSVPPSGSLFPGGITVVTCTADDGLGNVTTHTFSIKVNRPPVAQPLSLTGPGPGPYPLTLAATDADGDALSFSVLSSPASGSLTGTAPSLTYTPAVGFTGIVSFNYSAGDGTSASAPATVTITVQNVVPVADALSASTTPGAAVPLTLSGSDANGQSLTFAVATPPAHGALSGSAPALTYTPDPGYAGTDSFTYHADDGIALSDPALVFLVINTDPVAPPRSFAGAEDTPASVNLTTTDPDGQALTCTVLTQPLHGTLSGTPPVLTYSPALNYFGPDSFSYMVSDGFADSAPATASLDVTPVNDPPVALMLSVSSLPPVAFTVSGTDIEGDILTYSVAQPPASGTVTSTGSSFLFTPSAGFTGTLSFTFRANDGQDFSAPAAVTVTVENGAPVAAGSSVSTDEDVPVAVALSATDINLQPLTYTIVTPPLHGTLSGTAPALTFLPAENYNGPDSFTFTVTDGDITASAAVSLTILAVNDAPDTAFDVFSVNEDESLTVPFSKRILRNDSDYHDGAPGEDNNPLSAVLVNAPAHAASFALDANGTFTYTPRPDFHGLDGFTYRAVDAPGAPSPPETVLISVWAVNDAPVAASQSVSTLEDVPVAIHLRSGDPDLLFTFDPNLWTGIPPPNNGPAPNDADPDYTITTPPLHGILTGTAPHLVYTPDANYHGPDSFSFTASDGLATSNEGIVSITIEADGDGDALPDTWESSNFGSLIYNGSSDPDNDGQSNAFELLAGNSPASASESLTIEPASPSATGGVFRLNHVLPGVIYVLESSTDLQAWDRLSANSYEIPGPAALYDARTDAGLRPRCFYRVTVEPAPAP